MRPPGMGNQFGFGSFNPGPRTETTLTSRFPLPEVEPPPLAAEAVPAKPIPDRKGKYHFPPRTAFSDTDSVREKELEHMHIQMASLENEVRKQKKRNSKWKEKWHTFKHNKNSLNTYHVLQHNSLNNMDKLQSK